MGQLLPVLGNSRCGLNHQTCLCKCLAFAWEREASWCCIWGEGMSAMTLGLGWGGGLPRTPEPYVGWLYLQKEQFWRTIKEATWHAALALVLQSGDFRTLVSSLFHSL